MQLQVVSVGSLATMGPHRATGKVPMAAKSKPKKEAKPPPPDKEEGDAASKRKDISCMITSLKNSKDTSKAQLLAKYQSLPRFDPEKNNILKKWKLDKSCKWVSSYMQEVSQEKSCKDTELEGYGTRHASCNVMMLSELIHLSAMTFCLASSLDDNIVERVSWQVQCGRGLEHPREPPHLGLDPG